MTHKNDDKVENRVRFFSVHARDDTDTHITIDVAVNANMSRTKGEARVMEEHLKDALMMILHNGDIKGFHVPLHQIKITAKKK